MVWLKEGGDNGEKCRKTAEGRAGAQTATLHSPTSYSTSPRKHLYHFVHACLENGELKPAMKWDVGGIDFFLCQHWQGKRFMNMVIWHLPSSRLRVNIPRRRVATLTLHNSGNPAWCDMVASQEIATSIQKAPFPLEIKHTVTVLEQNPAARSARRSLGFPICIRHTGTILNWCNVVVSLCWPSGEVKYSSLDWK